MEPQDLPNDLIDLPTAAIVAMCNTQAIFRWIAKGKIRGWKRVGRLFVSRAEVMGLFKPFGEAAKPQQQRTARGRDENIEYLRSMGIL